VFSESWHCTATATHALDGSRNPAQLWAANQMIKRPFGSLKRQTGSVEFKVAERIHMQKSAPQVSL
jgi:hypothetical protein